MILSLDEIRRTVSPVAQRYGLNAVYLFGSYARGEATDQSDIDLLVDRKGSRIAGMFDMGGLYQELSESIGKKIDLVTLQSLEQESTRRRTPGFVKAVEAERVKIYG